MIGPSHIITTDFFAVEPGEDSETNPGCYGRALATYLADRLRTRGESVEGVIAEDFGWCVMLSRKPFMLWIGCGNVEDSTTEWLAYVVAEPGLLQRIFRSVDPAPELQRLSALLGEIMQAVPGVTAHRLETAGRQ